MTSKEEEEDDTKLRQAFEQFMLGNTPNLNNIDISNVTTDSASQANLQYRTQQSHHAAPFSPESSSSSQRKNQSITANNKAEKRYRQLFHKFCKIVQNDWIDTDNQMEEVLHSIKNIRSRLPAEMKLLQQFDDQQIKNKISSQRCSSFDETGIEHPTDMFLNQTDVNHALSHDLLQHEKMMFAMRKLLSDLSEIQDRLGRQLDDVMHHHLEVSSWYREDQISMSSTTTRSGAAMTIFVEDMNEMYRMLSRELYRKQSLAMQVFRSVDDKLLMRVDDETNFDELESDHDWKEDDRDGSDVISRCVKEWPRGSKKSCIDLNRFKHILSKCKLEDD